ncbi:MAG: hypothetical protein CDV28_10859 [Candidatus Electronema aureum]|uniref:Collagen triple helix repeat-containing protein n=1 Tax=Candidatus Electronema aureum TaxID=2005002 RepID=A0A521G2S4_9BACT|nr:MAG: hypothetical protein CDV28_10859 [Candidatus Electronema aureum]
MKTVQFGIGTAVCIALSGCTGLVTMPKLEGCYPVDALSVWQQTALHVGRGNPILLIGGKKFVCTCYQDSSLTGIGENGGVTGIGENGGVTGIGEKGGVTGIGEKGGVTGIGEKGGVTGIGEKGGVTGIGEKGGVTGIGEKGGVTGIGEKGGVTGIGEKGGVTGIGEKGGVTGIGEKGGVTGIGDFAEFSCRIVPECPGFQLIGYGPKDVTVLTPAGQKSVPAGCITW